MKQELFNNAMKLSTSDEISEYVQAEYEKVFPGETVEAASEPETEESESVELEE